MKCPHCGKELPEGYTYISSENNSNIHSAPDADTCNSTKNGTESVYNENVSETCSSPEQGSYNDQLMTAPTTDQALFSDPIDEHISAQKKKVFVVMGISIIVLVAAILFIIYSLSRSALKYDIQGKWISGDDLISSSTLTITDDTLSISETFGFMEITNITYNYTVTSSDTIEIRGTEFKVETNDNTLIITPGFSGNQYDIWYSDNISEEPATDQPSDAQYDDDSGII